MIKKNDLNEKSTSKRINMQYEEIKEKFEEIHNIGVKKAKEAIKDYEEKINTLKDTLIKSNLDQENRDRSIEQINKNLKKEKDKIKEKDKLMIDFFKHHNPNDRHISISFDTFIKIDHDKKEIAYTDDNHEPNNFIYKIEKQ